MTEPVRARADDARRLLLQIQSDVGQIRAVLGQETDDGAGGTGLTGRLIRIEARVAAIETLKNQVLGAAAAVTLFGALILMGVKAWLAGPGVMA